MMTTEIFFFGFKLLGFCSWQIWSRNVRKGFSKCWWLKWMVAIAAALSTSVYSHLLAIRPIKSIQFNVSSRFLTDMYPRIHYIHMQYLKCILTNSGMYLLSVSTLEIIMRGSCSVRRKECKQTRSRSFVRCSLNIIDILPAINYSGPLPKNARHYYITIPLFYYCAASPSWRQWQMLQQSESKVLLLLLSE